jgi:hypothetical protein
MVVCIAMRTNKSARSGCEGGVYCSLLIMKKVDKTRIFNIPLLGAALKYIGLRYMIK